MFERETEDRGAIVIPDFLFFGVKADSLADYGRFGACGAPYWERQFEADG